MSRLRPPQQTIKAGIFQKWNEGYRNVLVKSSTGSGKTVIFSDVVRTMDRAAAVIAHRSELVSQMSLSLAREGVRHRIIGPDSLRRNCVSLHMDRLGRSFYDPGARVGACGIDTLTNKDAKADPWFSQVGVWVQDEAHHLLRENKWGKGVSMFPNAFGLGMTATEARADGKGLGRHASGVFDALVEGPELREWIDWGYLTDYRIFAPPSDVDYSEVTVTASGDLSPAKLRAAVHASDTIVGDVVRHYLMVCNTRIGRLARGITFAVDVEAAKELAAEYKAKGVPAEIVTAKTPDLLRNQIMRKFEAGQVLQLVNVDLFGEGTDVPACEVVSMARKTESWPLFVQQFGRVLRLSIAPALSDKWGEFTNEQRLVFIAQSAKPVGYVIDHVGNVIRHGLPDAPHKATLNDRERRSSGASDAIPLRACANPNIDGKGTPCGSVYERYLKCCPYCNFYPEPAARTAPEFVDGDLFELTADTLAAMRGKAVDLYSSFVPIPVGMDANSVAAAGVRKMYQARQHAQFFLREQIALWAGWQKAQGFDDSQGYRRFYHAFGIDVLSAQALGKPEAEALSLKIKAVLDQHGVIAA